MEERICGTRVRKIGLNFSVLKCMSTLRIFYRWAFALNLFDFSSFVDLIMIIYYHFIIFLSFHCSSFHFILFSYFLWVGRLKVLQRYQLSPIKLVHLMYWIFFSGFFRKKFINGFLKILLEKYNQEYSNSLEIHLKRTSYCQVTKLNRNN